MSARGIIAVGDSITAHCSEDLALDGIPALSWVEWVARTLNVPISVFAKPGAATDEILRLLPEDMPNAEIALVFAGVNNTLSWRNWRVLDLEEQLSTLLNRLKEHSDKVVILQIPELLGKSRALYPYGPWLRRRTKLARAIITRVASAYEATLVDVPEMTGKKIWIDGVHPTSVGHLAMADATLAALGSHTLASDLDWTPVAVRIDFKRWKRKSQIRFILLQPIRGIGAWLLGH
ncbi:SGNH/GDSL hydrolase family protein [Arthrobacter crystallopoietes]|uniref:SGNH/GDSL hydrolase family protein n=1 Tax=Crystallibacter crystallopoietes TaxID=37928 RepID=UPI00111154B9|nr:SGNH/GDSL hydrolase family protein [Arthrobacter crystallopoietes]